MGLHKQCCSVQIPIRGYQSYAFLNPPLDDAVCEGLCLQFALYLKRKLCRWDLLCGASNHFTMAAPHVRSFHILSNLLPRSFRCPKAPFMCKLQHFCPQSCSIRLHKTLDVRAIRHVLYTICSLQKHIAHLLKPSRVFFFLVFFVCCYYTLLSVCMQ